MRTLIHLSDLHFGTVRPNILGPLVQAIGEVRPDLIAVSGDLTQRARPGQFIEARAFLDQLLFPKLIVPGNHDVPLYNLYARFKGGLERYRRYICADIEPFYQDREIAVLGINTARSLTFKGGRVNERQLALARERLGPLTGVVKIVVTHHPFDLPEQYSERALVGRARMALTEFADYGIDLYLAGHHHVGMAEPAPLRFKLSGHSALLIQAGTTTSMRGRGESNSFNIIRIERPSISVERMVWEAGGARRFTAQAVEFFRHDENGWSRHPKAAGTLSQISTRRR